MIAPANQVYSFIFFSEFGSTNISSVDLIGVTKAYRDLVNGEGGAYKVSWILTF